MSTVETDRLIVRAAVENDRARFVQLFTDEASAVPDLPSEPAFSRHRAILDLLVEAWGV